MASSCIPFWCDTDSQDANQKLILVGQSVIIKQFDKITQHEIGSLNYAYMIIWLNNIILDWIMGAWTIIAGGDFLI